MYGVTRDDVGFYFGSIPERKKPCLFIEHRNASFLVGQFKDEESATAFMKVLEYVCFGTNEEAARKLIKRWEQEQGII